MQIYFDAIEADAKNDEIARILNEKGYRTLNGRLFTSSFTTWASNRKYKGDYTYDVSASKNDEGKRNTNNKKPQEEQVLNQGSFRSLFSRINGKE